MSYIRKMGGYRSYRPATSRRSTSRRTYQRPKAKPGPRATIKRSPKPVVRRRPKPKAISRPSPVRKTSVRNIPKVKVTPKTSKVSKVIYPGMPSNVRAILEKQEAAKKRQTGSKAGMPSKVANILKEQEAAKKASTSKGTNQSRTTNPVRVTTPGVSYQKSTQNQGSNASTAAKIYQKPSVTASAPTQTKVVQKKKAVLEDLNLSKERNKSTKGQEEKAKKTQVDKIVVREQESIGITNREGKRVLVERDYSKKKETKDYRSLRIRNHLSKAQNDKKKSPAQIVRTSLYINKRNLSRFNKEISNKEKTENRTINIHRDGTALESLKEELYGLDGVKRNPEYLFQKINTREEIKPESKEKNQTYEPIRINSASDYQAYVREQKRAELQKYDYEKKPDAIRINSASDYQAHVREPKRAELQKYDYVKDPETTKINSVYDYHEHVKEELLDNPKDKFYQNTSNFLEKELTKEVKNINFEETEKTIFNGIVDGFMDIPENMVNQVKDIISLKDPEVRKQTWDDLVYLATLSTEEKSHLWDGVRSSDYNKARFATSFLGEAFLASGISKLASIAKSSAIGYVDDVSLGTGKTLNASNKIPSLLDELVDAGVKYNADDVVAVVKNSDGKLMWLENGNSKVGLTHILERHADDFAAQGVSDIPKLLEDVLATDPIKTGGNAKGLFADYILDGNSYRVAYGTNGFVVSFYPID